MHPEADLQFDDLMKGIDYRLLAGADASAQKGNPGLEVLAVTSDSRQVKPGTLFFAVKGSVSDGHAFLGDALDRGAVALALEDEAALATIPRETPEHLLLPLPVLEVEDGRQALAKAAANLAGNPGDRLSLVGITGTNGKTTVSWILEAIALAAKRSPGVVGTVAFRFAGVEREATHTTPGPEILQPLLAEMLAASTEVAILEVSSHALDQRRVEGCTFAVGIFTGLSRDHLDYHRDLETYFAAKARLFRQHLAKDATSVISLDGAWGRRLFDELARAGRKVVGTSVDAGVDASPAHRDSEQLAWAEQVHLDLSGITATLHLPEWEPLAVRSPMVGQHNLANLLSAAAAAQALGFSPEAIQQGLLAFPGPPGRLERVGDARAAAGAAPRHTFIDYAHTDDALARVIDGLRDLSPEAARIVVVFGCGGDRDRGKRPLMAAAAARADRVIITSDNPRTEDPEAIIAEILPGLPANTDHRVEADRRAAIALAASLARPGDVLLIAGKGHETYQLVGDQMLPFDDAEVASLALASVAAEPRDGP